MNGVVEYQAKWVQYHPLKSPLIAKNRYTIDQKDPLAFLRKDNQLYKPKINNLNIYHKKIGSVTALNIEDIDGCDNKDIIQLRGLDTRINYTLKKSQDIYDKVHKNRAIVEKKKNSLYKYLNIINKVNSIN